MITAIIFHKVNASFRMSTDRINTITARVPPKAVAVGIDGRIMEMGLG